MFSGNKSLIKKYDNLLKISRRLSHTLSHVILKIHLLTIIHQLLVSQDLSLILLSLRAVLFPMYFSMRM